MVNWVAVKKPNHDPKNSLFFVSLNYMLDAGEKLAGSVGSEVVDDFDDFDDEDEGGKANSLSVSLSEINAILERRWNNKEPSDARARCSMLELYLYLCLQSLIGRGPGFAVWAH